MILNIVTPVYYGGEHRLRYFKKYIEHVNKLYDLDSCHFIFLIEPNSENMVEMIPSHWNKTIFRNYYNFGPILNHHIGFKYCFDVLKLDFVLLLEDDIIVSPDIVNLTKYCLNSNILNENVLCLLNKHKQFNPTHNIYNNETKNMLTMNIPFDSNLDLNFKKCGVVTPVISRANQIGEIGVNYTKSQWDQHGFASIEILDSYKENLYRIEKID
jgi:hypothetical protein